MHATGLVWILSRDELGVQHVPDWTLYGTLRYTLGNLQEFRQVISSFDTLLPTVCHRIKTYVFQFIQEKTMYSVKCLRKVEKYGSALLFVIQCINNIIFH